MMDGHGDFGRGETGTSSIGSSHSQELVVKNTFLQLVEPPALAEGFPRSCSDSDLSNSLRNLRPTWRDSSGSSHASHDCQSQGRSGSSLSHDESSSRASSRDASRTTGAKFSGGFDPTVYANGQLPFPDDDSGDEGGSADGTGNPGGELLSRGSALHSQGTCKPCLYYLDGKDRCKHGADCVFCHEFHQKKRKRAKKKGKGDGESDAASSSAVVLNTTGAIGSSSTPLQPGLLPAGSLAGPLPVGPIANGYRGPWCTGPSGTVSSDDEAGSVQRQRPAASSKQASRTGQRCILRL
mmetsp:Transcript_52934/g.104458  ORF Transcript_52934/g.104458 Transcript_52934/m.104458 type:complete len:295 (-) Transcript_52934:194-1078(-)